MLAAEETGLSHEILFIDIGSGQDSYFTWSNPVVENQFSKMDVITARSFAGNAGEYVHLKRKESKVVFRQVPSPDGGIAKVLIVVGTAVTCQHQVMEAVLDFIGERWFTRYGGKTSFSGGPEVFVDFAGEVRAAFEVVPKERVRMVLVNCRACHQVYKINVKTALVDHASSFPVPLVFVHANHALLIYIDRGYQSRGECLVNVSE